MSLIAACVSYTNKQLSRTKSVNQSISQTVSQSVSQLLVESRQTNVENQYSNRLYLIVSQVNIFHGQKSQLVGSVWISSVLHVSSDGEKLHWRHYVRGCIDDDLIGCLEADRSALA